MAERTLAILVTAKGAIEAARNIGKVDQAVGGLGRTAATGFRTAGANLAKLGLVVGSAITLATRGGLASLAELESAVTSVAGAIDQMGLSNKVQAGQVATWANEIEAAIGAAFDDKAITQATATLIRFGKVTPDNIRAAMVVMTDLAAKTGDVDSAATLLAKALADPTKAAGKLARSGVILTKSQQDQIKAFVKAGKVAEAQKVILDSLAETTKGAAAASQGPYKRAMSVLADVTEDAQRALATGFLPVIEKVANLLGKELAKPETLRNIREFGQGLAGGLDKLIDVARGLPWATIGDSLRIAGMGAKAVFDAFMSLPPWVQTAVLTGWGLNKLSGGALGSIVGQLGSIVGQLGKGLIKGVLGINAGVVNVRGAVVNGGGMPGGGASPGGAGRPDSGWLRLVIPLAVAAAAVELGVAASGVNDPRHQQLDPRTGRTRTFRGTNVAEEQIANLERTAVRIREQLAAGNVTGGGAFERKQLAGVEAEIAKLRGVLTGASPQRQPFAPTAPLPASGDPRLRPGALDVPMHASLDKLIGRAGGAFLREGSKSKTLDENAGKLVALFETSTNPSLHSMQANLAIIQGLAASGDVKTRQALGGDIAALQALIDRKLTELAAAMSPATTALALLSGGSWWAGEKGAPAPIVNVPAPIVNVTTTITARAVGAATTTWKRAGNGKQLEAW